jgi:hypothetical protein
VRHYIISPVCISKVCSCLILIAYNDDSATALPRRSRTRGRSATTAAAAGIYNAIPASIAGVSTLTAADSRHATAITTR